MGKITDFFKSTEPKPQPKKIPRFWAKWNVNKLPRYRVYKIMEINKESEQTILMDVKSKTLIYLPLMILTNNYYGWRPYVIDGGKK